MASLYNMLRIICSPLAALLVVLLTTPAGVLAQIPSTTNAAQSSGNNSFGASTSPIGTPTYNTSPESINSLNQAVNETLLASTSTLLKAIAAGSASDASLITSLQALLEAAMLATSSTDSISALQALASKHFRVQGHHHPVGFHSPFRSRNQQ